MGLKKPAYVFGDLLQCRSLLTLQRFCPNITTGLIEVKTRIPEWAARTFDAS